MRRSPTKLLLALLAVVSLLAAACGDSDDAAEPAAEATTTTAAEATTTTTEAEVEPETEAGGTLTIYSGRSEELIADLLTQFTESTGIEVEARYGDTAEMAALILEEGGNSPADVYFGQDAGALGALSAEGRLVALPDDVLGEVDPALRSTRGEWTGISGRARTVVYNTDLLSEDDLPASIADFTDPQWKGKIGWAPTNGSFQAFVTALRVLIGEDETRAWLEGIIANEPVTYERNTAIVEAVAAGEVEVGFTNHYYLFRYLAEDPDYPAANYFFPGGDPGSLVNVAGVGVVDTSDQQELALEFVRFLLSAEAQEYFASATYEIPLAAGVAPAPGVPTLAELTLPDIDLNQLEDLAGTLALLTEVGAL
jgi:iron(III) transport system substrate-binding protein